MSLDQATLDNQSDPPRAPQNQPLRLESIPKVRVLKYIPKAAREQYGQKLGKFLDGIVKNNTPQSWERLFLFSVWYLRVPSRINSGKSLSSHIKIELREEQDPALMHPPKRRKSRISEEKS